LTEGGFNQFTTHAANTAVANTISLGSECKVTHETIEYEALGAASTYTFDKPEKGDFGIDASVSHLYCFSGWNTPGVAAWFMYNSNSFSCDSVSTTGPKSPTAQHRTNGTAHYFAPARAGNRPARMRARGTAKTTLERGVKVHSEAVGEYEREVATSNLKVVEDSEVVDGILSKWDGFRSRVSTDGESAQVTLAKDEVVEMGRGARAEAVRGRLGMAAEETVERR